MVVTTGRSTCPGHPSKPRGVGKLLFFFFGADRAKSCRADLRMRLLQESACPTFLFGLEERFQATTACQGEPIVKVVAWTTITVMSVKAMREGGPFHLVILFACADRCES